MPVKKKKIYLHHRWTRVVSLVLFLFFFAAIVLLGIIWFWARPTKPDSFYNPPPGSIPADPGVLLKYEPFTGEIPSNAQAWRILYTTTKNDGSPGTASAVVVVPKNQTTDLPIIAWAHGTTGIMPGCAPSLLNEPYPTQSAVGLLEIALQNNWAFVGTDYIGQGTKGPNPFLIGPGEAPSVLDSVRAAKQIKEAHLGNQTVVWGHSQGGHSTLWSGIIAPSYAKDLNVLGVAAFAPASDLPALVQKALDTVAGKIIASYVITAYSSIYPDVNFNIVNPNARLVMRDMASRCLVGKETLVSVFEASKLLPNSLFVPNSMTALENRLNQNVPNEIIDIPLFVAQGEADELVFPSVQNRYIQSRCEAGQNLLYTTYAGRDHLGLVASDSPLLPDLIQWTKDRFEGKVQKKGCTIVNR